MSDPAPNPAHSMEATIRREPSRLKRCWMILGPGLTSGAANTDPSAIATYAIAGATFGLSFLWVAPVMLPMMAATVYLCAKLGMISGRGLGGILRHHYPRWLTYVIVTLLVTANTFNAGADLAAIVAGIQLIVPLPDVLLLLIVACFLLAGQIWGTYRSISRWLKYLTFALFAFVLAGLLSRPDPTQVLRATFLPSPQFSGAYLAILVACVGTGLSPYLYFWQAGQRVEEEVCMGRRRLWQRQGSTEGELRYASLDVGAGMAVAAIIIYFILLTCGQVLPAAGHREVSSAADIALALTPLAGKAAGVLFAVGFLGAGLMAVPVLTTAAAYALAGARDWPAGLNRRPRAAPQFYLTIVACTFVALLINLLPISPIRLLFTAAVINGLLTPVLLTIILLASNNSLVMHQHPNRWWLNALGLATVLLTGTAAILLAIGWAD